MILFRTCCILVAFSANASEETNSEDAYNVYDKTSPIDDVYAGIPEIYDEIGEPSHYTELNVVRPKKETKRDTDEDDTPAEPPPEPPPLRPHTYLELVNL